MNSGAGFDGAAAPSALKDVQIALEPDEALLEYVIPYNPLHPASDLWMMLITRNAVKMAHVPLDKVLGLAPGFTGRMAIDGQPPVDSSALGDLVATLRTDIRSAETVAERVCARVASTPLPVGDGTIALHASAGVAAREDSDRSLDTLLRRAERALRHAKDNGGNRVQTEGKDY